MAFAALTLLAAGSVARAQGFRLFPEATGSGWRRFEAAPPADLRDFDLGEPSAWKKWEESGFGLGIPPGTGLVEEPAASSSLRRCVLLQCVELPAEALPPPKLFTTPVSLWTATALLGGVAVGLTAPANSGFHHLTFTDEGFFQTWTYAGGADKASHFVICADVAELLDDAYRLNRLTEDQSLALSFATSLMVGFLVEIGDGVSPYGFSAQDLAADALGALSGALLKRHHLDDLVGFRLGKVPLGLPEFEGHVFSGITYSTEIYTADLKLEGLARRLDIQPGIGRFFLFSFAFLTKGYGYTPPIEERYQEVGLEVGLNFPEILKAVGVRDTTWWGDLLLRMFGFLRIPFTQAGVYYNLANRKWYGPGAPSHFY